ncbi:Lysophospholipase D gdpd1 [Podochytrium sp. JEL0797]|nr:Lysophospholipase D gdpd1 [Podochytrium sp. JEL0797]
MSLSRFLGLLSKPAIHPARLAFPTDNMSHRGGSLESIENTLTGFRKSAAMGVDLLEMDIYMTKDGQCVVFHDSDLGRLCGLPGKKISDFEFEELPTLLVPSFLSDIRDELLKDKDSVKIPLFEDVLREFPTYPMQIDVKEGSEEMVIKVGNLIKQYKRENQTVWGSFRSDVNQFCHKNFSDSIPLFFSFRRFMFSYLLSYLRITHWMEYRESALICPDHPLFMRRLWFEDLNRLGISVILWGSGPDAKAGGAPGGGVNSVAKFEALKRVGVNGICTDAPSLLRKWLKEHGPLDKVDRFRGKIE